MGLSTDLRTVLWLHMAPMFSQSLNPSYNIEVHTKSHRTLIKESLGRLTVVTGSLLRESSR